MCLFLHYIMYLCIHRCNHAYIDSCIYLVISLCIYLYMYACMYGYMYTFIYVYMCLWIAYTHPCIYASINNLHGYMYIYASMDSCTHVYMTTHWFQSSLYRTAVHCLQDSDESFVFQEKIQMHNTLNDLNYDFISKVYKYIVTMQNLTFI